MKVCPICQKEFDFIRKTKIYCSEKCKNNKIRSNPKLYSVETICACGCGQTFYNPDSHYRYRKFIAGHVNKNGLHSRLGTKEDENHLQKRIASIHKHFKQKQPTCIEVELYSYLDTTDLVYEKQYQIGRTIVDAYVPKYKLCVYADGLYWHSKPYIVERDKRINRILINLGYSVLRLPSTDNGYHLDLTLLEKFYSGAR